MRMSVPTQTMAGNLRFTRYGTVWADFILSGLSYGLRPDKDKLAIRDVHMALFRALPGESLFIGACAGLDPAAIVDQMLTGIDPEEHPDWVDECAATLDTLDQIGPGQRIFWLSVPLSSSPVRMISEQLHSMRSDLVDALALPRGPIPSELLRRATKAAARVEASIPAMLQPSPATAAQMTWLHAHMMHRGLHCDLDIPVGLSSDAAQPLWTPRGSAFVEPVLDEGGQTDRFAPTETDTEREDRPGVLSSLTRSLTTRLNPLDRRFLKVSDPSAAVEDRSSYQALLVLAGVPQAGGVFPGGELLGRIDESTLEVDWAMRLTTRSSGAVARKNQRALTNLNEQFTQRDGEVSHALNALDRIAVDLAEYVGILTSEKLEVECQPTVMFAVSGPTAESATAQAQALTDWFGSSQYKVVAPIGLQEELWWAMHPGVPTSRAVREFSQLTTSKGLASIVPLATSRLGDHSGMLLGLNITAGPMLDQQTTCGPALVTMHDLEGASDRQKSGSVAVGGELGAGKTATLMTIAGAVRDRGGRLVIVDRTTKAEWASWASSITDAVVIDPTNPTYSLDPLRLFGARSGARIASAFLTTLLNVSPTSPEGGLLSEVLDPDYLSRHKMSALGDVLGHLSSDANLSDIEGMSPGAGPRLALSMRVFARKDFGRVIFDAKLPPAPAALATVVLTREARLPSREDLEHEHLFAQLEVEKIWGRALHALIAAHARQVCFADTSELACFVVSEAHAVTMAREGEQMLIEFLRDGRKHRAVLLLDFHDPIADLGSPTLRGLIPTRLLMRLTDRTLAKRGLEWMDLDPEDESLIELITKDTSPEDKGTRSVPVQRRGEGLLRDLSGDVGRVKILLPRQAARAAAITAGGSAAARRTPGSSREPAA